LLSLFPADGAAGGNTRDGPIALDSFLGEVKRMQAKIIKSNNPQPLANYTEAFDVDGLIFAAGQLPTDFKTGIPVEAKTDPNFPFYGSDIKKRTHYIMNNLARTFEAAGSSLDHIVKAQVFLEDLRDFNAFDEVWKEYFKVPPARTTVATTGLLVKDAQIEIDLIGYAPNKLSSNLIKSGNARPIAHYTEAFTVGGLVFAAGQLPTDFKTGIPAEAKTDANFPFYGSDIKKRTHYIMKNLARTFEAAGSSLEHIVKAQVFLEKMADHDAFQEVWRQYFKVPPPTTVVGTNGLLVKDADIEIDLIGYIPNRVKARAVKSSNPGSAAGYTEAVVAGGLVFAEGQLPTDFASGIPTEARIDPNFPFYGSDIKLRTRYVLKKLARTLEAAGSSLDHVVKAQVFLDNLRNFSAFDEVWKEFFKTPPARTTVETNGLAVKDAMVAVDLIAYVPGELALSN
jgi:reactive intermediate/imine deaminase